jgi:hypothetical protein
MANDRMIPSKGSRKFSNFSGGAAQTRANPVFPRTAKRTFNWEPPMDPSPSNDPRYTYPTG